MKILQVIVGRIGVEWTRVFGGERELGMMSFRLSLSPISRSSDRGVRRDIDQFEQWIPVQK